MCTQARLGIRSKYPPHSWGVPRGLQKPQWAAIALGLGLDVNWRTHPGGLLPLPSEPCPRGDIPSYPSRASLLSHTSFVCLTAWLAKEGTSQPGPASQKHQLWAKWGSLNPRDGKVFAWRSPIKIGISILRLRPWPL